VICHQNHTIRESALQTAVLLLDQLSDHGRIAANAHNGRSPPLRQTRDQYGKALLGIGHVPFIEDWVDELQRRAKELRRADGQDTRQKCRGESESTLGLGQLAMSRGSGGMVVNVLFRDAQAGAEVIPALPVHCWRHGCGVGRGFTEHRRGAYFERFWLTGVKSSSRQRGGGEGPKAGQLSKSGSGTWIPGSDGLWLDDDVIDGLVGMGSDVVVGLLPIPVRGCP
jgi:hypothetical protein